MELNVAHFSRLILAMGIVLYKYAYELSISERFYILLKNIW